MLRRARNTQMFEVFTRERLAAMSGGKTDAGGETTTSWTTDGQDFDDEFAGEVALSDVMRARASDGGGASRRGDARGGELRAKERGGILRGVRDVVGGEREDDSRTPRGARTTPRGNREEGNREEGNRGAQTRRWRNRRPDRATRARSSAWRGSKRK